MSYVIAAPEIMTAAATDLATIGSTLDAAHRAAGPTTLAVAPAAADEVSVSIAHLFSQHAQDYQAVAAIVSLLRGLETSLQSLDAAYNNQIGKFITGSESWINLVPPPLQTFVVGIPVLSIFVVAFPFAIISTIIEEIIAAIGGLPG
jgi:hypothetical protein